MPVLLLLLLGWWCFPGHARAGQASGKPQVPPLDIAATSSGVPALSAASADPLATLDAAQLQELFQWLSRHAVDPAALSQEALNRAALRSLLADPRTGAVVLTTHGGPAPEAVAPPLHARLGTDAAYARAGALTAENVAALSAFLTGLPPEVTTLLLDLRAPQAPSPLSGAAALANLFLPEKTPLYLLISPPAAPALQVSATAPVWTRRVWLLLDNQTPPPAELAAHLLVRHLNALAFGTPASGILTETIDRPLGTDTIVRLPSATVSWPDGTRLSGTPLVPQIPVQPRPESRQALLTLTDPAALPSLLAETDHPRPNEAALMAGTPPEILTSPPAHVSGNTSPRPDPVLQQAADLLQTAAFLKLDAPEEIKRAEPGR